MTGPVCIGDRNHISAQPQFAPPSPKVLAKIRAIRTAAARGEAAAGAMPPEFLQEPSIPGMNDGIVRPDQFPLPGTSQTQRSGAAAPTQLRGSINALVVLVDFEDKPMTAKAAHFEDLFFSKGKIPTGSVREFYEDVSHNLITVTGKVVGPFRLPKKMTAYANGASGRGTVQPNIQTLGQDALTACQAAVGDFGPFDNDKNGFVDAFVVVHAGSGAETTGSTSDIWSVKWLLPNGPVQETGAKVYAFLTVPEDAKLGVCAHELGHLLFGWPDFYDTTNVSSGLGNFCLMADGVWGDDGNRPVHPSAWCKAQQGWIAVQTVAANLHAELADVKTGHTAMRVQAGTPGLEYFLMENRELTGFDSSLPGAGLMLYHVDDAMTSNTNPKHYWVGLIEADGGNGLATGEDRGDAGDPFPGTKLVRVCGDTTNPNTLRYDGTSSRFALSAIGAPGDTMTFDVAIAPEVVIKPPPPPPPPPSPFPVFTPYAISMTPVALVPVQFPDWATNWASILFGSGWSVALGADTPPSFDPVTLSVIASLHFGLHLKGPGIPNNTTQYFCLRGDGASAQHPCIQQGFKWLQAWNGTQWVDGNGSALAKAVGPNNDFWFRRKPGPDPSAADFVIQDGWVNNNAWRVWAFMGSGLP